jgi:predicted ATP-dependent serine protease
VERRLGEAARLGFKRCLIPRGGPSPHLANMEVIAASHLGEALRAALRKGTRGVGKA